MKFLNTPLQQILLFSFCEHFIRMRNLFNHSYGTDYSNEQIFEEISKLDIRLFGGLPEFAIQMHEKEI